MVVRVREYGVPFVFLSQGQKYTIPGTFPIELPDSTYSDCKDLVTILIPPQPVKPPEPVKALLEDVAVDPNAIPEVFQVKKQSSIIQKQRPGMIRGGWLYHITKSDNSQTYDVLDIDMGQFCEERGLSYNNLLSAGKTGRTYSGWIVTRRQLTDEEKEKMGYVPAAVGSNSRVLREKKEKEAAERMKRDAKEAAEKKAEEKRLAEEALKEPKKIATSLELVEPSVEMSALTIEPPVEKKDDVVKHDKMNKFMGGEKQDINNRKE